MPTHLKCPDQCSRSHLQRNLISEYFHHLKYYHGNGNVDLKIELIELEIAGNIDMCIYIYMDIDIFFSILDSCLRNKVPGT